jgi:antitoxin component YwqK of YwqJK toxin-antitoxin module
MIMDELKEHKISEEYKTYHPDGTRNYGYYNNVIASGHHIQYYNNGNVWIDRYYKEGSNNNYHKEFDDKGVLVSHVVYQNRTSSQHDDLLSYLSADYKNNKLHAYYRRSA